MPRLPVLTKGPLAWDLFDSVAASGNAAFLLLWAGTETTFESDFARAARLVRDFSPNTTR
jgi:hypothetical protein